MMGNVRPGLHGRAGTDRRGNLPDGAIVRRTHDRAAPRWHDHVALAVAQWVEDEEAAWHSG